MTPTSRPFVVVAVCLLCSVALHAQHWTFQNYGAESGLKNPTVLALHQDGKGFLWASTEGGLFQYDGDRFRAVAATRPGNAAPITSLHTSPDGQLWAGSIAGLFLWSGERFVLVPGSANLELESGQAISSDSKQLYLASNSGLWVLPLSGGQKPRQITVQPAASVFAGADRTIWFGCGSSLCQLQSDHDSQWKAVNLFPTGPWNSITEDSDRHLWIRSADQILVRDTVAGTFRHIATLRSTRFNLLVSGRHGEIMAPHSGGLAICRPAGCTSYGVDKGLLNAEVLAVNEDREGSLWIGYSGSGLARWIGRDEWQSFGELEGLSNLQIWRIVRDSTGKLWIGTSGGLFEGEEQAGRWLFRPSKLLANWTVYGLMTDPDGSLWLGTFQPGLKGLVHYNPQTGEKVVYPPAQPQFSITGLSRDSTGTIWVTTPKQLLRLNVQSKLLETVDLPVSGSSIYSITHTSDALYVSSQKGLYIERGSMHRLLTAKDGLKDTAVQSVTVSPSGELWIAYFAPVGLSRLTWKGDQFELKHLTTADGLTSNLIYSQFFDARGRHWVGTDEGAGVLAAGRWIRFDTSNGMVSNDCNAYAYLAEPDGAVWVGTSGGLSRFFPAPRNAPPLPSTLITAVVRNNTPTADTVFASNTRTLALRFTMLSYEQQSPLFRYRLANGSPWIETHTREVQFAELPPGSYHFEVQGNIRPGYWSHPATRDFFIRAPWFRSWPFLTAAASLFVGLIWFGWQQREKHQRKLRADLEAAVAERTRGLAAATARAEQESRFKGEFLANMSHEMRTPLNGVLGLTNLALELSDQPEVVAHLSTVQFSAKLLLSLINDILDLAKIEAGMMEIVPVAFAPRILLQEVRSIFDPDARSKNLRLEVAVAESVPEWLHADDSRLRQVLVNLIGNALKFTQAGGVTVSLWHDGSKLRCSVVDTGIGIAPAQHAKVFDVFRQVDGSTSRRYGGSGLGLAISQKLVQSMAGSINLESEPDQGSTFSFAIVAPETAAPPARLLPKKEVAVRPLRILVAEDNKVNQILLLALLRKRGHDAVVANNGREALEAYSREYFDLLLMDIQMPEMDGIEAVRRIRRAEESTQTRIPVVAVTARVMVGDRDEIMAAGMDDYLEKPIKNDQLDEVLRRFSDVNSSAASSKLTPRTPAANTEFVAN